MSKTVNKHDECKVKSLVKFHDITMLQGHTLGAAMTGGMGGGNGGEVQQAPQQQQAYQEPAYQQQQQQPCQFELKQFIECTQNQNDISMCTGFNEVLRECKLRYSKFYAKVDLYNSKDDMFFYLKNICIIHTNGIS